SFGLQYELATFPNPPAGGTIQPSGSTFYNAGDTASVLAIPNFGYAFTSWTGSIVETANPVSVIMDTAKGLIANFERAAIVRVLTNPPGRTIIVDGQSTASPDTFSWLLSSTHTINTVLQQDGETSTRYRWLNWSDSGAMSHTVTVNRDSTFTADFQTQHYLYIGSL